MLAEALIELPEAQALLVGDALFGEQAYRQSLEDALARSGVAKHVRLTGFRSDIPALMQLCDVIVHTSTAPEPFGRVIVEGMLAGRPVIASDAGGAAEIVENEDSGLLIPPGDPTLLAGALRRLLADPLFARRITARTPGRHHALAFFGLETTLTKIDDFLATMVGSTGFAAGCQS